MWNIFIFMALDCRTERCISSIITRKSFKEKIELKKERYRATIWPNSESLNFAFRRVVTKINNKKNLLSGCRYGDREINIFILSHNRLLLLRFIIIYIASLCKNRRLKARQNSLYLVELYYIKIFHGKWEKFLNTVIHFGSGDVKLSARHVWS